MRQFGEDTEHRIKAAVRRLVKTAGGTKEAAALSRAVPGSISYYTQPHHDQHMPVDVVADLEKSVAAPLVTAALADLQGYELVPAERRDPVAAASVEAIHAGSRAVAIEEGQFQAELEQALADGRIDNIELTRLIKEAEDASAAVRQRVDMLYGELQRRRAEALKVAS